MNQQQPQATNKTCGKCGAPIEWQMTIQGNWTPQNLDGTPHWATCPHAAEFRRRRKRSSKDQMDLFERIEAGRNAIEREKGILEPLEREEH